MGDPYSCSVSGMQCLRRLHHALSTRLSGRLKVVCGFIMRRPWPRGPWRIKARGLLDQLPVAVLDGEQFDAALVKAAVVFGGHIVDALGAGKVFDLLERVAQGRTEGF